jgi:hypothetical protein
MGHPTFPFIGQGKDLRYAREKNGRKRKTEEETTPGAVPPSSSCRCVLLVS